MPDFTTDPAPPSRLPPTAMDTRLEATPWLALPEARCSAAAERAAAAATCALLAIWHTHAARRHIAATQPGPASARLRKALAADFRARAWGGRPSTPPPDAFRLRRSGGAA